MLQRSLPPAKSLCSWVSSISLQAGCSLYCIHLTHLSCWHTSGTAAFAATLGQIKIPTSSQCGQSQTLWQLSLAAAGCGVGVPCPALTIQAEVTGKQLHHKDFCVKEELRLVFQRCKLASRNTHFMYELQCTQGRELPCALLCRSQN